jgi:hypothetical protein
MYESEFIFLQFFHIGIIWVDCSELFHLMSVLYFILQINYTFWVICVITILGCPSKGFVVWFLEGAKTLPFFIVYKLTLGSSQSLQWVISSGVKQLQHEDDNSPATTAEIKNGWCCIFIVPYVQTACTKTFFF